MGKHNRSEVDCHRTIFRVLGLSDAAIWSGPLVVVLGQGQGSDARTRRRFAAGSLWFLQTAVIVAVLGGILQVLHGVGRGEGHSPMGVLEKQRDNKMNILDTSFFFFFFQLHFFFPFDGAMETAGRFVRQQPQLAPFKTGPIKFTLQKSENSIKY